MTSRTYVNFTLPTVDADWLNDTNGVVYDVLGDGVFAPSTKVILKDNLGLWISVTDYGAVGNGIVDDTTSIQMAIDSLQTTGGVVYFPPGIYKTTVVLTLRRGVSLIGAGSAGLYDETDNIDVTTIKWGGASGGTMVSGGQRWNGRIESLLFDANNLAANIWSLGAPQGSVFRNCVLQNTPSGVAGAVIAMTTTGQFYPDGTTQYPSAGFNIFDTIIVRDARRNALHLDGTLSGATTVGAITENVFINCQFLGIGTGQVTVVMNKCVDTNFFYGGAITCGTGASSTAIGINFSATNNETFGNVFYGVAIGTSDVNGVGIDARNNIGHNFFYGCYMPSVGTIYQLTNGAAPGRIKFIGAIYGATGRAFKPSTTPTVGASPYTYTNNDAELQQVFIGGGTTTAVSITRDGVTTTIPGISTNLITLDLEPTDAVVITYSAGAPTVKVVPH